MGWISHNELEKSTNTSGMEDFDSVGGHLITNEVEGEVNVLEEEGNREESVEELAWGLVLQDLHPHLHLLTVGTLHEVVRVAEVHVIWPHTSKLVRGAAGFIDGIGRGLGISNSETHGDSGSACKSKCFHSVKGVFRKFLLTIIFLGALLVSLIANNWSNLKTPLN